MTKREEFSWEIKGGEIMNYICGKCIFATEEEANQYRNLVMKETRVVLGVFKTNRKVTHVYEVRET